MDLFYLVSNIFFLLVSSNWIELCILDHWELFSEIIFFPPHSKERVYLFISCFFSGAVLTKGGKRKYFFLSQHQETFQCKIPQMNFLKIRPTLLYFYWIIELNVLKFIWQQLSSNKTPIAWKRRGFQQCWKINGTSPSCLRVLIFQVEYQRPVYQQRNNSTYSLPSTSASEVSSRGYSRDRYQSQGGINLPP